MHRYITTDSPEGMSTFDTGIPEAIDFEWSPFLA